MSMEHPDEWEGGRVRGRLDRPQRWGPDELFVPRTATFGSILLDENGNPIGVAMREIRAGEIARIGDTESGDIAVKGMFCLPIDDEDLPDFELS